MSAYLIINICIVIIPVLLSFEKNVRYYTKLSSVFKSVIIVGIIFLTWDVIATERGDWSFNPEYTGRLNILGLPLEEVLFFITVPYSIIFVYESFLFYLKDRNITFSRKYYLMLFVIFIIIAIMNISRDYTATVMFLCSLIFLFSYFSDKAIVTSRIALLTILISFIPFFLVNYLLTSLPVVEYNPEAITGTRVITIPVEDFFYSFAMISGWLIVYDLFRMKDAKNIKTVK